MIDIFISTMEFQCDICSKTFSRQSALKRHKFTIHGSSFFSCYKCDKEFNRKDKFVEHCRKCVITCKYCDANFKLQKDVNEHVNLFHTDKKFVCTKCEKKFVAKRNMQKHQQKCTQSSKWMCVICEDMTFDKRWFLERHILERHSDFAWKCPECKKLFQRRNSNHGCSILESQTICFQSSSGRRGKETEEDLEKFKTKEMPKKIKLLDSKGNEIELAPRRNRYAKSEIGETSYRTTGTNKGVELKKRGSSLRETSRKRTDRSDIENKENNNISGPTPAKICKPAETKEQRLKKIKDVLQDLMSENGETITISVEPEADKVEENTCSQILEEEVELHVSETEMNTFEKADNYHKSSSTSTASSGSSSSSFKSSRTAKKPTPDSRPQNTENVVVEPVETEIELIRNVEFSAQTELVETFLQSLQDTQENTITLNVGGMKIETSKTHSEQILHVYSH